MTTRVRFDSNGVEMSAERDDMLCRSKLMLYPAEARCAVRGQEDAILGVLLAHPHFYRVGEMREALEWLLGEDLARVVRDLGADYGPLDEVKEALALVSARFDARLRSRAERRRQLAAGGRGRPRLDLTSGGFPCAALVQELLDPVFYKPAPLALVDRVFASIVLDPDGTAPAQDYAEALDGALSDPFEGPFVGDLNIGRDAAPFRPYCEGLRGRI